MENKYLYYHGEQKNPFQTEEDFSCNRHMWWHYEQSYFHDQDQQKTFPALDDYIKDVLNNKVDFGDLDGRLFRMYKESSVTKKED